MESIKEKQLTIKSVRNYFIYALIGCLAITILGSFTTVFTFYYNTNNNIENLVINDKKQDNDIKNINKTLLEINNKLGSTNTVTAVSDERINSLETSVNKIQNNITQIQDTQIEILKILGNIQRHQ